MTILLAALVAVIAAIYAIQTGIVEGFMEWVKEFVLTDVADIFWRLIPANLSAYLQSFDMAGITSLVSDINWFIPFWQVTTIYFTAISLASSVLLVRYIIGWIPTIEG